MNPYMGGLSTKAIIMAVYQETPEEKRARLAEGQGKPFLPQDKHTPYTPGTPVRCFDIHGNPRRLSYTGPRG
jgi:hypothetical protein